VRWLNESPCDHFESKLSEAGSPDLREKEKDKMNTQLKPDIDRCAHTSEELQHQDMIARLEK